MRSFLCRMTDEWGHTDDDAKEISAESPEKAACSYTEQYNQNACEYPHEREVVIIDPDGMRQTLTVYQESVPQYWVPRKRGAK